MKSALLKSMTAIAVAAVFGTALGQTGGTGASSTTTASTTTAPASSSVVTGKLVATFSDFAGSTENATALVTGLRSGSAITLTPPTTPAGGTSGTTAGTSTATATSVTFAPPTKPMGYGNIRIALALAQTELASQGITQPTPQQIEAALMGGSVTSGTGATAQTAQMPGVLQMRADGMGWGKIANTLGFKLGTVMSGLKHSGTAAGIATASGSAAATGTASARGNAYGRGIVTATGSTAGGANVSGPGNSGKRIAAGGSASVATGLGGGGASGVVTAGGAGNGQGGGVGHGKGGGKP